MESCHVHNVLKFDDGCGISVQDCCIKLVKVIFEESFLEIIDVFSCYGDCSSFMYHAVVVCHFCSVSV